MSPKVDDLLTGSDLDRTVLMVDTLRQVEDGEALAFVRNHRVRPTRSLSVPS